MEGVRFGWPGAAPLLDGLDLSVRPGELLAIAGRSGGGKSTILRLIAGLLRPQSGRVSAPDQGRAFVFQSPTLLPWRSVADNVGLPLELSGLDRAAREARVREALVRVDLEPARDLLPRQLSGGMAMRASLARALVTRPSLLLLDEPFSALDMQTRRTIQQTFLKLWTESKFTAVLVTHDIDEAVLLADRVLVLGAAPGRFMAEIPVPLARPRAPELLHDPRLGAVAAEVERWL